MAALWQGTVMGDWGVGEKRKIMATTAELLVKSFQELRRCNEGLTPATLEAHPMITQYLEGLTPQDRAEELRKLAYGLDDTISAKTARNALAIGVPHGKNISERRREALRKDSAWHIPTSERDIDRKENDGFLALADLILKRYEQRIAEGDEEAVTQSVDFTNDASRKPHGVQRLRRPRELIRIIESPRRPYLLFTVAAMLLVVTVLQFATGSSNTSQIQSQSGASQLPLVSASPLAPPTVASSNDALFWDTHGWGPPRPTFTEEKPAPYAVFDSITDEPTFGDERYFLQCHDEDNDDWRANLVAVNGHTYECAIWFDNDVSPSIDNGNPAASLHNARVRVVLPSGVSNPELVAYLSADNAATVWASCTFIAANDVTISYVKGSARMLTKPLETAGTPNGIPLAETYSSGVMTSGIIAQPTDGMSPSPGGALLGSTTQDGLVRQFAGWVLFAITVTLD
jgi:hypothetical protein